MDWFISLTGGDPFTMGTDGYTMVPKHYIVTLIHAMFVSHTSVKLGGKTVCGREAKQPP